MQAPVQLSLLEIPGWEAAPKETTGEMLAEAGAKKVLLNEESGWLEKAMTEIRLLASSGQPFNTDDLHFRVPPPKHFKSFGAVMLMARRSLPIEQIGWEKSIRKEAHARMIPLYRGKKA
jgi:hypothetical protein